MDFQEDFLYSLEPRYFVTINNAHVHEVFTDNFFAKVFVLI